MEVPDGSRFEPGKTKTTGLGKKKKKPSLAGVYDAPLQSDTSLKKKKKKYSLKKKNGNNIIAPPQKDLEN